MRNLKRALSLTLASVMLLGMMVVGSSAASFPDVDANDNVEAIEVLKAVGVMIGDDGNFKPDEAVTRNEMATVMARLLDLDYNYYEAVCPFGDVSPWARGYVGACYANGVIKGRSADVFDGQATVTAVEAAAMMMRALGYFQYDSDYKDGFKTATVRQASKISLFAGIDGNADSPMTRNQVAQLALNTLESGMVEAKDNTLSINTGAAAGNISITGGKVDYVYITSGDPKFNSAISNISATSVGQDNDGRIVELGEKLYNGDLKRFDFKERGNTNSFGAPSTRWTYKNSEIGDYAETASCKFEGTVKSNAMYSAVGKTAAEQYRWVVTMDGANKDNNITGIFNDSKLELFEKGDVVKNDSNNLAGTKRGATTYVYLDDTPVGNDRGTAYVTIINTYAAEISRVSGETIALDDMDKPGLEFDVTGYAEEDVVLYTKSVKEIDGSVVWTVKSVLGKAELVEDKVDAIRDEDRVVIGDKTYFYNYRFNDDKGAKLDVDSVNENVAFYLDTQGNIIRMADTNVSNDYALVYSVGDAGNKYGANAEYGAKLILTDGTTMNVDIDSDSTDTLVKGKNEADALQAVKDEFLGKIVSYSKDEKSGAYTLILRTTGTDDWSIKTDDVIKAGQSRIQLSNGSFLYADENSAILINTDLSDDDNYSAYKGYQNAPTVDANAKSHMVYYVRNGVVKAMFINGADSTGSSKSVIFVKGDPGAKRNRAGSEYYYAFDAVVNGEVVTLKVKEGTDAEKTLLTEALPKNKIGVFFGYTEDSKGLVTKMVTELPKDVMVNEIGGRENTNPNGYYYTKANGDNNLWKGARWNAPGSAGLMAFNWVDKAGENGNGAYTQTPGRNADALIVYANTANALRIEKTLLSDRNDEVLVVRDDGVVIAVFVQEIAGGEVEDDEPKPGDSYAITVKPTGVVAAVDPVSIKADETATLTIVSVNEGYDEESVTVAVTGADYVKNEDGTYTISKPTGAVTVTVTATKEENNDIDPALKDVLKLHADDIAAGIKIAEAHIITNSDDTSSGKYNAMTVGSLYMVLDIPANVTATNNAGAVAANLTGAKNGMVVTTAAASNFAQTTNVIKIAATEMNKLDMTQTMTLGKVSNTIAHELTVKNETGNSNLRFSSTTPTVDESADDLKLNITAGIPAYATEVDIVYKVEGLSEGTLDGTEGTGDDAGYLVKSGVTASSGALTGELTLSSDAVAEDDVVITVKSVTPSKVSVTVSGVDGITCTVTEVAVGTKVDIGDLTVPVAALPNGFKATVSYTITGATSDGDAGAPQSATSAEITGNTTTAPTIDLAGGDHFTATGNSAVNIEITGITFTEVTGASVLNILPAGQLGGNTVTGAVTSGAGAIALTKNGDTYTNTSAITVTLTAGGGNFGTAEKTASVTFSPANVYSGSAITTTATATTGSTVTFTIAAGTLTIDPMGQVIIIVTPNP